MKHIKGDLLEADCDALVHVANSYKTFGSGIAYHIKNKFPQVYQADLDHEFDILEEILGNFTKAIISKGRVIYNLYAMWGLGNDGNPKHRNLSYDAFYDGILNVVEDALKNTAIKPVVIGFPYLGGCCRAGGSWKVVEAILNDIEGQYEDIEFHIYELENAETIAHSTIPDNVEFVGAN